MAAWPIYVVVEIESNRYTEASQVAQWKKKIQLPVQEMQET